MVWHYVPFTNVELPLGGINVLTVANTLLTCLLLFLGMKWAIRGMRWIPHRRQTVMEALVETFESLLEASLGEENRNVVRRSLPLILTLFVFILLANSIVLIPLPYIEEPTGDLNCTMALAILALSYAAFSGIRAHGIKGYVEEFCGPMWHQPGAKGWSALPGKLSAGFFFPLKVIEEISRVVSLSCRLFGNIMGAAIIMVVISTLGYYLFVPLVLDGFLLFFEAALQAFVFASLTIMYISSTVKPD